MIRNLQAWVRDRAGAVWFRLAVAAFCLAAHLFAAARSGDRFNAGFNAAPGQPPAFRNPAADRAPERWNRLVVSRWDAGQYIGLGLRGYAYCPPRGPELPKTEACNLAFYPAYGALGRAVSTVFGIGVDVALLAIALCAGFLFLFLWTGPALVSRLGRAETWIAFLLFNTFTTAYILVTPNTEALTLALLLGAFVALSQSRLVLGALLAGAASGVRVTGVAVTLAFIAALVVQAWCDRRSSARGWAKLAGIALLSGWGEIAFMAYQAWRFGDPLAYVHAHAAAFNHHVTLGGTLLPDPALIVKSLEHPMHEGMWLAAAILWFLLGHRTALARFPPRERAFWYVLFVAGVGIPVVGQLPIALAGMNRYLLLAVPLFFAMAAVVNRHRAVLVVWLVMTTWHYWNVDLCEYTGGPGNRTLEVCHAGHWVRR